MIYLYGGAFDPITMAHEYIIRTLVNICKNDDKLVIAVSDDDEKNYITSIEHRVNMVKKLLKTKYSDNCPEVIVQKSRMWLFLNGKFPNEKDITIVIGQDELEQLIKGKWYHSQELMMSYNWLCFKRSEDNITVPKNLNVEFKNFQFFDVSSSNVRKILDNNPFTHYKDVKHLISHTTYNYIKDNELYNQNPPNYDELEKQFISDYKLQIIANGWAEPSVTADILAHNGDKILLIRRKNYPYKNCWCLPGGFFDKTDESIEHTGARELEEETTIVTDPSKYQQIKTYSHNFDPRMRIIDVAMSIRISAKDMKKAIGSDDAADARWFNINELPEMGFHHRQIVDDWLISNE